MGVISASPTPFWRDGSIDFGWVEAHLDYLRRYGAHATLVAGTTGEGPSISLGERRELIDVIMAARGSLGVIVGCGYPNIEDTIAAVRYAHDKGADGALVVPPFFFKNVPEQGLVEYYSWLIDGLAGDSNICLYNIPGTSAVEITDGLVQALQERYPGRIEGLKDSSGELERTRRYVNGFPGLRIWCGSDENSAEAFKMGAHGAMTAGSSFVPDLNQAIRRAVESGGDVAAAQARLDAAMAVVALADTRASLKLLIQLRGGLPEAFVRPPLAGVSPEADRAIREGYERLDLPVASRAG